MGCADVPVSLSTLGMCKVLLVVYCEAGIGIRSSLRLVSDSGLHFGHVLWPSIPHVRVEVSLIRSPQAVLPPGD